MVALPTLGGRYSRASDINDKGVAVGNAELSTGPQVHAVAWTNHRRTGWGIEDLGTLPGFVNSSANSINKHGVIVGWSYDATFTTSSAFMVDDDTMTALPGLGGLRSAATGINAKGQIVGWSEVLGTNARHAVLWDGCELIDLNTVLAPGSGWVLSNAAAINEHGDIIGTGTDPDGNVRGYILKLKHGK